MSSSAPSIYAGPLRGCLGPAVWPSSRRLGVQPSNQLVTQAVRGHVGLLMAAVGLRIAWELSPMLVPAVVGWLVDGLASGGFTHSDVWRAAAAIGGLGVLQGLSAWGYTEVSARLSLRVITRIRGAVFRRVLAAESLQLSQGDLLSRALRDTERLRGFVDRVFIRSLTTLARAVFPMIMLFTISWALALWALALLPMQQILSYVIQKKMQRASRAAADAHAELTDALQSRLAGAQTLQVLDAVDRTVEALERRAHLLEEKELANSRLLAAMRALAWTCTALGLALVWMHGGQMVLGGTLTLGALVSFTGYTAFIFRPLRQMTNVLKTYRTGLASVERIVEIFEPATSLDHPASEISPALAAAAKAPRGLRRFYIERSRADTLFRAVVDAMPGAGYIPARPVVTERSLRANLELARPDASEADMRGVLADVELGHLALDANTADATEDLELSRRICVAQQALRSEAGPILINDPTSGLSDEAADRLTALLTRLGSRRAIVIAIEPHKARTWR